MIYFLLLLIPLIKFIPFLFYGLAAIPLDLLLGAYYPWLLSHWGFYTTVPVKNPVLSDVISQLYPWLILAKKQIFALELPLWNPTSLLGYPYYANYHSSIFFPTNLLMLLGGEAQMRTLGLLILNVVGFFSIYLYLRTQKFSISPAIFGSIIFIFGGLMTTDFEFSSGFKAIIWLPLCLASIEHLSSTNSKLYFVSLPIAYSLLLLSGHFQVSIYSSFIILVVLISKFVQKKNILLIVLGLILGILIASPQLLPSIELLRQSIRTNDPYVSQVNNGILPAKHLITTFFAPDFFGNPSTGNYFGFWNYREAIGYFGIIGSIFYLIGLFDKRFTLAKIGSILSLLFIFFPPLANLPYDLQLPLLKTAAASRLLFPFGFFASIIAANGFQRFFSLKAIHKTTYLLILAWVTILIFTIPKGSFEISIRNSILPTILLFISFAVLYLTTRFPKYKKIPSLTIVLLLLLDLTRFHYKFNVFTSPKFNFPETPLISFLRSHPGKILQTTPEIMPPNTWSSYLLDSALGYDPLYPVANGIYLMSASNFSSSNLITSRYVDRPESYDSPLWDLAGVKYLITLDKDEFTSRIDLKKYTPVFKEGPIIVFENLKVFPQVYLHYQPQVIDNNDNILEKLQTITSPPALTTATLTQKYSQNGHLFTPVSTIQSIGGRFQFDFRNDKTALLVFNTPYYSGWHAYLDGQESKIIPVNYLYSAIEIAPGEHTFFTNFLPTTLLLGLSLAAFAIMVLSIVAILI